jgi:hypothetical protein
MVGTSEARSWCWEELDKVPRQQALTWIREILVGNRVPKLEEEIRWWAEQLKIPDN